MAMGIGRGLLTPMVVIIFLATLVELGLAGWAFNRLIDRAAGPPPAGVFQELLVAIGLAA